MPLSRCHITILLDILLNIFLNIFPDIRNVQNVCPRLHNYPGRLMTGACHDIRGLLLSRLQIQLCRLLGSLKHPGNLHGSLGNRPQFRKTKLSFRQTFLQFIHFFLQFICPFRLHNQKLQQLITIKFL